MSARPAPKAVPEIELPPLPHDLAAERAILGAVLLDNTALVSAAQSLLQPADFFLAAHRTIYSRMLALDIAGSPIDFVTLKDALARESELDNVGGVPYISTLADGLPRINNVPHYVGIVKDKAVLRSLAYAANAVREQAIAGRESGSALSSQATATFSTIAANHAPTSSLDIFDTPDEWANAPSLVFAVEGFLQSDAATIIAGLSGHFKTWLMLSLCKSLLDEKIEKLWDTFPVKKKAERIIYLIPESSRGPFHHRLDSMGLMPYIRSQRLLVRTLSKGPAPLLQDPRLLANVKHSHVVLDTAVRFMQGDENAAGDNAKGLATDIFVLLGASAESVTAAAHSPKSFESQNYMSLENMVRGSGDIGATFATAWGIRQLPGDVVHVESIKHRDFEACGPFQLAARPHISETGDFRILKRPGECGLLADEMPDNKNKGGGASQAVRDSRSAHLALMRRWLAEDRHQDFVRRFKDVGIEVASSTIRKYRSAIDKGH